MSEPVAVPEVKPEILFLFQIIEGVVQGKIRIPRFQRPFVWRRDQMLDLLDSIRKQYPIGSLLMWDTETAMVSLPRVGHVSIPDARPGSLAYVLDGHQRLSTFAGVLTPRAGDPDPTDLDPGRWEVWFNAKEESFEHPARDLHPQPWHFRLHRLMDTVAFLEECRRIEAHGGQDAKLYLDHVTRLARTFQAYKLPAIRIGATDLQQAVEIFARLNSKGQRMSADQMVSALAYAEDPGQPTYDLAADIDRMRAALAERGFGGVDRPIILRAVLATAGQDIYRTDWTRLTADKRAEAKGALPDAASATERALLLTADFLRGLGVHSDRLLPYAMQAVLLSVFLHGQSQPTQAQRRLLERWFWMTSFTAWFASGNPSRVRWLIEEFRELADEPEPVGLKTLRLDEPALPFPRRFDMRSARARTLLLVLLSLGPRDDTGELISEPWSRIASDGPSALGNVFATVRNPDLYSSPANRIVRFKPERGQAKGWLLKANDAVLRSHGIPPDARALMERDEHDAFIQRRLEHLIQLEREFMAERGVTPPTEREPQAAPIDTDDNE